MAAMEARMEQRLEARMMSIMERMQEGFLQRMEALLGGGMVRQAGPGAVAVPPMGPTGATASATGQSAAEPAMLEGGSASGPASTGREEGEHGGRVAPPSAHRISAATPYGDA